jgi:hypothetical protein
MTAGADLVGDLIGLSLSKVRKSSKQLRPALQVSWRLRTEPKYPAVFHELTWWGITDPEKRLLAYDDSKVAGMVISTALSWSAAATIALAVVLAFFFGYLLTSIPLLRAGMA